MDGRVQPSTPGHRHCRAGCRYSHVRAPAPDGACTGRPVPTAQAPDAPLRPPNPDRPAPRRAPRVNGRPMRQAVNPGRRPVMARSVPGRPSFTHRIRPRRRPRNPARAPTCGFSPSEMPRLPAWVRLAPPGWPGPRPVAAWMALSHLSCTDCSGRAARPRFVHSVGTSLWTRTGTSRADVGTPGVQKPVGEGGQARSRMWTGGHPPVHDAGRRRGHRPSVHFPSPGSRRVLDSSSTGRKRLDQRERALSPASTSVKTRNELRPHGMPARPHLAPTAPRGGGRSPPTTTPSPTGPPDDPDLPTGSLRPFSSRTVVRAQWALVERVRARGAIRDETDETAATRHTRREGRPE